MSRPVLLVVALLAAALALPSPAAAVDGPGTLEVTGPSPDSCPTGFTCHEITVTCADAEVPVLTGSVAIGRFSAPRRGTLVAFGGGGGQGYWIAAGGGRAVWKQAARAGLETVTVAWDRSWNDGTVGVAALACRPAVLLAWAAARDAAASPVPAEPGVCGVCAIGYSLGSAQAATAVAFHDLADVVDGVVSVSGPPTADIVAGCARDGTPLQFLEPDRNAMRRRIDDSLDGGAAGPGACSVLPADDSAVPAWQASSLAVAGRTEFPATRFWYVWGRRDRTGAVGQGLAHVAALHAAGTPLLGFDCLAAPHDVFNADGGVEAIIAAILWQPADGLNVPPAPEPALDPRCPLTG